MVCKLRVLHIRAVVIYPLFQKEVAWTNKGIMWAGVSAGVRVFYNQSNQIAFLETVRASVVLGERAADPNHTAASLLLPFSLFLSAALSVMRLRLSSHILPLIILFLAILLTGSRGGLLAWRSLSSVCSSCTSGNIGGKR